MIYIYQRKQVDENTKDVNTFSFLLPVKIEEIKVYFDKAAQLLNTSIEIKDGQQTVFFKTFDSNLMQHFGVNSFDKNTNLQDE